MCQLNFSPEKKTTVVLLLPGHKEMGIKLEYSLGLQKWLPMKPSSVTTTGMVLKVEVVVGSGGGGGHGGSGGNGGGGTVGWSCCCWCWLC